MQPRAANASIPEQKAALRRELRALLRSGTPADRQAASARAIARLAARPEWQRARCILMFAPRADELDLWPLAATVLAERRRLALPRFVAGANSYQAAAVLDLDQDLAPGAYGIPEPRADLPEIPLNQLDLVLVPGLGFDQAGRRLGRGRGYYDRLLAAVRGTACGVAMDEQLLPSVPAELHDERVDCILTPSRWLAVAQGLDET